jgi:predicted ribosome quality control (RQC) complex YloA/Tae2 family protein
VFCDALTVAAVADELRSKLVGGRVQQVLAVDQWVIGLEVYANHQRHYLILSAQPEEGGRIHLVQEKLRRGLESPTPLLLRLRKCTEGGHLTNVHQPPHERLLLLTIEGPGGLVVLIAEVMGRLSNIVLMEEDGTILECARHVRAGQNRYRVLLPGYPYTPPPPQQKADPATLSAAHLTKLLATADTEQTLWKRLVAALRAVSPLLAREVVYRTTGDGNSTTADTQALLEHLHELVHLPETREWQPTVALSEGATLAYAPYSLTQYAEWQPRTSISEAMADYYRQEANTPRLRRDSGHRLRRDSGSAYAVSKHRVEGLIAAARERQLRKQEALLRAQPSAGTLEGLRHKGELLLAYARQVSPGQAELVVNLGEGEPPVHITLDPTQSPIENAQEYFRRYEKAKGAAASVPDLLAAVNEELAYLDQLSTDLALAEDQPGIAAVESALSEAGHVPRAAKTRHPTTGPLRVLSEEGFVILVGRNSWQNEEVTFRLGAAHDLWLHAQGVPGAHVIVRTEGRDVPEATLEHAAQLAAHFSAARQSNHVPVDYTARRNVHRRTGGRPGQVTYRGQRTIVVRPCDV